MRRLLRALVAVSMLAALVSTASAAAPLSASSTPGGGFVPGEVTVGLEPGTEAQGVAAALSGRIDRTLLASQTIVISVGNPVAAAALARALPGVRYAEPNWIRGLHSHDTGFEKPNDGGFDLKWDLHNDGSLSDGSDQSLHGADMNWLAAYNSLQSMTLAPTVVAVLDTGVDLNHPDLKLTAGWDFIANDSSPEDGFGHGTHVAGIVGARTNNGANSADVDTAGVAFSSAITVMPIKVCDNNGSCPSDAIANGI
ncbi:MAG TPA: S8 family serine peptidase, partial [Acidimicrobiia bacterium]|nr:S8 family serine peptidase [Acidimicrobiia bacterium]